MTRHSTILSSKQLTPPNKDAFRSIDQVREGIPTSIFHDHMNAMGFRWQQIFEVVVPGNNGNDGSHYAPIDVFVNVRFAAGFGETVVHGLKQKAVRMGRVIPNRSSVQPVELRRFAENGRIEFCHAPKDPSKDSIIQEIVVDNGWIMRCRCHLPYGKEWSFASFANGSAVLGRITSIFVTVKKAKENVRDGFYVLVPCQVTLMQYEIMVNAFLNPSLHVSAVELPLLLLVRLDEWREGRE